MRNELPTKGGGLLWLKMEAPLSWPFVRLEGGSGGSCGEQEVQGEWRGPGDLRAPTLAHLLDTIIGFSFCP